MPRLIFGIFSISTTLAAATIGTVNDIADKLAQADQRRHECLQEYSVTRRYTLRNARMRAPAEMTVQVEYRRGEGKNFQVLSSNAEGMSGRVFRHVLDGEAEAGRKESQIRLTPANYDFKLLGTETRAGRLCYLLDLTPKKKTKYVLQGKAWIDAEDFAVVRIEGRPAANISFWVGKPYLVIEFEKVGEFWMAARNQSRSDSRILGATELSIEYSDYQVQGAGSKSHVTLAHLPTVHQRTAHQPTARTVRAIPVVD